MADVGICLGVCDRISPVVSEAFDGSKVREPTLLGGGDTGSVVWAFGMSTISGWF
jgi:hypothetical protein